MFEDIKNDIKKVNELITKAVEADKAARKAYLDSADERRGSVEEKIKELQAELDEKKADNELRPQEMAEALSIADADAAIKIEKEIAASNAKIVELEHKISLLSRAMPKGDSALFYAAIKAYRAKFRELKKATKELEKVDTKLKQISRELEEKKTSMEDTQRSIKISARYNLDDSNLIEMVESFEGPIDVFGHSAGKDEMAKIRYIRGNLRGIEATLAGQKLKEQIQEDN